MVVITSYADKFALAIEEAKADVAQAQADFSRAGGVGKINAANSRLCSARQRYTEWQGGRIPDHRGE
jgi:hypothetical protein